MTVTFDEYQSQLHYIFEDKNLVNRLASAAWLHRQIEQDFCRQLTAVSPRFELMFPHKDLPTPAYVQKNLFSIFLLSILETLGIAPERVCAYALITHAIRGVVTATDNILDNEANGAVQLHMGPGRVAPNMMLAVLQDGIIHRTLTELTPNPLLRCQAWHALMEAVFAILSEESGEEGTVDTVLPPEQLLDTIHSLRGGRLFQLAFVIPEVIERELAAQFACVKQSIYSFGLAIQILDDLADLAEDVAARNHNFLQSWILHKHTDGQLAHDALHGMTPESLNAPECNFPHSTHDVALFAASTVHKSFALLRDVGYPMTEQSAGVVLRMLFQVRGIARLWDRYAGFGKENCSIAATV